MDALIQDVRYGIRQLFRYRGSSLVAVLTLALGIGVSTAIFSVIDATMLRPLPYPDPEQLVTFASEEVQPDGRCVPVTVDGGHAHLAGGRRRLLAVAGWGGGSRGRIADGPEPERIGSALHRGLPADARRHADPRPRISCARTPNRRRAARRAARYGYWQSRYAGRPDVMGETIRLDADVATIVGVLPAWFNATTPFSMPLRIPPKEFARRGTGRVSIYGRLRPDVTVEQAARVCPRG